MHQNIIRLKAVNELLKDLNQEFVFVGGATTSLYAPNDKQHELDIRPTDDVDVVIELASYGGYAAVDERLRSIGFSNDVESGVICRYKIQGIIVDMMPTESDVLGFSNQWYPEGFRTAELKQLDEKTSVKIFTPPYFMASKMEAFNDRAVDFYSSQDLEDMVFVIEHLENFENQMKTGPSDVFRFLSNGFASVIERRDFKEALFGHAAGGYFSKDVTYLEDRLRAAFDIPERNRGYMR